MSIAGIFKEVTTITVSAWVFGDELTPLNVLGIGITFIGASYSTTTYLSPRVADHDANTQHAGIGLYTHHKYQKALHSPVPLDAHGNPLPQEEAEEILQSAMRLDFPPEEGFIDGDVDQYSSPSEDEGYEGERRNGVKPHLERDGGLLPPHERQ
jgi:solute carrier family 35 protein C2